MREIKFSYIYQHDETGRIVNKKYSIEDIEHFEFNAEMKGYTLVERRQFTGVKDKNEEDIYGGDVIFYSGECKKEKVKVEYIHGSYGFSFQDDIQGFMLLGLYDHLCEVVENAYEK